MKTKRHLAIRLSCFALAIASVNSLQAAEDYSERSLPKDMGEVGKYLIKQESSPSLKKKALASDYGEGTPADRWAMPLSKDAYGDSASKILYLDQGWSPALSMRYYFTDQGTQLIDYNLFTGIEQEYSDKLFVDPQHMATYRYLPQKPSPENPDGLPVGFLRRKASSQNYLSITCAACHTSQINYQGVGIRIDGAGTQANFVGFLKDLRTALIANLKQTPKFVRLAYRILGDQPSGQQITQLRTRLEKSIDYLTQYEAINQSPIEDGFARVDAIGRIYNQVLQAVHSKDHLSPDAPASYPFLWDTSHHDYVQWIGLTPNAGPGALGRNSGEVIGVFGEIKVVKQETRLAKLGGYVSSVQTGNLNSYEQWLWDLKSPQWPKDVFPKIDTNLAGEGRKLYIAHCVACHRDIERNDPKRLVYAQMYEPSIVGTDTKEIDNALRTANTGLLKGALTSIASSKKYGEVAPVGIMLSDLVSGVLLRQKSESIQATLQAKNWGLGIEPAVKQGQYLLKLDAAAYKARPLNGIWATAPYLHNGSVPTLQHLLLPVSQRPTRFAVGYLEFDPSLVGYKHEPSDKAPFIFDTQLPGNSNKGHEFGTTLNDSQRRQLLEYLKTL